MKIWKKGLSKKPVIIKLNPDKKIWMEIDASDYVMNRVLSRENENKK